MAELVDLTRWSRAPKRRSLGSDGFGFPFCSELGMKPRLDMGDGVFFDHLDADRSVFSDLVYVGSFQSGAGQM